MDYYAFGYIMLVTVFYAIFYYLSYKISDINNIDWTLLGSTLLIGVGIGLVQAATGIIPKFDDIKAQMAMYAVFVAALDQLLHQIWYRYFPEVKAQQENIRKGLQAKAGLP